MLPGHKGRPALEQVYRELYRELLQISGRRRVNGKTERARIFEEYRVRYGATRSSFYRWRALEFQRERSPLMSPREQGEKIRELFELQASLSDADANRWFPAGQLLKIAVDKGIIQAGEFSARHYNRLVRQMGLRKPRGFVRFQASYSNEMHQFDASGSEYLEAVRELDNGDWILRRRFPNSRGKNRKVQPQRLWVAGIVDDFSGVGVWRYYVAKGESFGWMHDFLLRAWDGIHKNVALRGMPERLYADNGPFTRNNMTVSFLSPKTGLGIELLRTKPYSKQAHGKVERPWRSLWQTFELGFLGHDGELLLSELNDHYLLNYMVAYGEFKHRSGTNTRAAMYLKHLKGRVRVPPKKAEKCAFRVETRKMDGSGCFQFNGRMYVVEEDYRAIFRESWVLVYAGASGEVCVESPAIGQVAKAAIWNGPRQVGDFESFPETANERIKKARAARDYPNIQHTFTEGKAADDDFVGDLPGARVYVGEGSDMDLVIREIQEDNPSPMARVDVFANEVQARGFIASRLGVSLLEISREAPKLMAEIEALTRRTLDKQEISDWCEDTLVHIENLAGGNL